MSFSNLQLDIEQLPQSENIIFHDIDSHYPILYGLVNLAFYAVIILGLYIAQWTFGWDLFSGSSPI